jgi:hypothetical protein
MKLLTKEIMKKLPPIYTNADKKPEDVPVIVKFFHPLSRYTLYVTEGQLEEDGDWILFGYCVSALGPDCDELGYTSLRELESTVVRGVRVERDMYFGDHTLAEVMKGVAR